MNSVFKIALLTSPREGRSQGGWHWRRRPLRRRLSLRCPVYVQRYAVRDANVFHRAGEGAVAHQIWGDAVTLERHGNVGGLGVQGQGVVAGVDRDGLEAEIGGCAEHPDGDLAAVRDEHGVEGAEAPACHEVCSEAGRELVAGARARAQGLGELRGQGCQAAVGGRWVLVTVHWAAG